MNQQFSTKPAFISKLKSIEQLIVDGQLKDAADQLNLLGRTASHDPRLFLLGSRLLWLDADPWPRLDWSTGIWTDEGFYTYNARNAVLFGQAHLDEFNNDNLMPLLDMAQRGDERD